MSKEKKIGLIVVFIILALLAKSEIPTVKEKEIYLEWFKYINQDKLGADQPIMKKYNLSEKESDNIFLNIKTYIIFKSSYMKKERDNKNDIIYNCNIFFTSCTGIIIL